MNSKFLIIIASCFLVSGAYGASLPTQAMVTTQPMSPFLQRMAFNAKIGAFVLSQHIIHNITQSVTNSISHYISPRKPKAPEADKPSYIQQGLAFTSAVLTDAGINWALLPLLFPQKRHPFQFCLSLAAASTLIGSVTQPVANYCLSKVSSKTTKGLLLSLGLALPAIAGLEYLNTQIPFSITRACTGVSETPLISARICAMAPVLSLLIPVNKFLLTSNAISYASFRLAQLTEKLEKNPADGALWKEAEERLDAIKWVFTDEKYSFVNLNSEKLIPQFILDNCLEKKENLFKQLEELLINCPNQVLKTKFADILLPAFLRDSSAEIDSYKKLLTSEEQTLDHAKKLASSGKRLTLLAQHLKRERGIHKPNKNNESELELNKNKESELALIRLEIAAQTTEKKLLDKAGAVIRTPCVETESIEVCIANIKKDIKPSLSALTKLSATSNQTEIFECCKTLKAHSASLEPLLNEKYVVPDNRLKLNAYIKSFATKLVQILESKFASVDQELTQKASLSSKELATLSSFFQEMKTLTIVGCNKFASYLDQDTCKRLDLITQKQIPQILAKLTDATFALKLAAPSGKQRRILPVQVENPYAAQASHQARSTQKSAVKPA